MEMLVTKFSKGKYRNEGELFSEPISAENVKLMGEMIALQALRTVKKYDMKIADKLYIGLIKDLHHMNEIDYIVSDGYDCAQTAMGYLKGKSTMIIFERYARLKYKYGNRHFWSRGYYVSTVGGNKQAVQKYIQNQEKEDLISAQISMVEYYDPFEQWLKSNLKK